MPPSGRHRLKINGIDWLNDLVMAYIDRPRTSIAALSPPQKKTNFAVLVGNSLSKSPPPAFVTLIRPALYQQ